MIDRPIYCITSDVDWASSYCLEDFLNLVGDFGVTPTLFATHDDPVLRRFSEAHPHNVGVHPNFRPNSSHGEDYRSVIEHVFGLYPKAKTFRSHAFYDSSDILQEMVRRGIKYDSNLCLYLQAGIVPLRLGVPPIARFPVFWEDDCHWMHAGPEWRFSNYADAFTTPGLKIINVHPFMICANIPSAEYYSAIKQHITTLSGIDVNRVRHQGPGARTFFLDLMRFLTGQKQRFHTLHELFLLFPMGKDAKPDNLQAGEAFPCLLECSGSAGQF